MTKRFKHEKHGWTHAFNRLEEERLIATGWVEEVPEPAPEPEPEVEAEVQPVKRKYTKRT